MKESPILFTKKMVAAILACNKTQTRRLVKGVAIDWLNVGLTPEFVASPENGLSKFGYTGDWLWVREKFMVERLINDIIITYSTGEKKTFYYKSLSLAALKILDRMRLNNPGKWLPSIFMLKEISRVWLQINAVRIQQLNDISYSDARDEGVEKGINAIGEELWFDYHYTKLFCFEDPRVSYFSLWDSINNIQALANPWVWVYQFQLISATGKPQQP